MKRVLPIVLLGLALAGGLAYGVRSHRLEPPAAEGPVTSVPPATSAPGGDTTDQRVIPGERVGPVTPQTSRADLAAIYGEAALRDSDIDMGEGFTEAGTVVNPGSDHQFAVVWQDATRRDRPSLVRDFGPAWRTPEGLGIGVTYATVKAALGDFQIYGFAWDYGGTIDLKGSQLEHYDNQLMLRMPPAEGAADAHQQAYETVMGDALFDGDHPALGQLDLSVHEMVVYFDPAP
ncbi:hypothetical protein [Nodosilinea sp. E11]|uniref:hypothetical protein n=1 Tax=Nodosilinea sp. E11 TaxID=3037479 RepID=UPI0029349EDD|nr:hypothetical protein [Nodosilinea sp. E11]WOD40398.1 hypothetical protein RRF56_06275 [Nodosilinea sp. E11]